MTYLQYRALGYSAVRHWIKTALALYQMPKMLPAGVRLVPYGEYKEGLPRMRKYYSDL